MLEILSVEGWAVKPQVVMLPPTPLMVTGSIVVMWLSREESLTMWHVAPVSINIRGQGNSCGGSLISPLKA